MGSKPQHLCQNQGPPTELVSWAFLWLWLQWVEDERIQSVNSREDIGLGSGLLIALSATDLAALTPDCSSNDLVVKLQTGPTCAQQRLPSLPMKSEEEVPRAHSSSLQESLLLQSAPISHI